MITSLLLVGSVYGNIILGCCRTIFYYRDPDITRNSVPELVFMNCCFLGQIDPSVEEDTSVRYHELAANLATQFIKIGAKVVIAAGWAVDG